MSISTPFNFTLYLKKTNNMNEFILGENPIEPNAGLWIIHLHDPIYIIEVVEDGAVRHSKNSLYSKNCSYLNPLNHEEKFQLILYHFFSRFFADEKKEQTIAEDILYKAYVWYLAYLKWEDENIINTN